MTSNYSITYEAIHCNYLISQQELIYKMRKLAKNSTTLVVAF